MAGKRECSLVLLILYGALGMAQSDSLRLPEVTVTSYLGQRPVLRLAASAAVIDSAAMAKQAGQSLVPVLNTVPGVRMEERSPGSYRLSVRGSLIRSPFGVRNTKIYLDDFPLTNAGGDAYLNLVDVNCLRSVEVLKGPDGSLFGANSGGVVRLSTYSPRDSASHTSAGIGAGSYGLFQEHVATQQRTGKTNLLCINEGWLRSDGYRRQSALDRRYVQLSDRLTYAGNAELRFFMFYSDLHYQTPGGLTLSQFEQDPREARAATATLPGAEAQHAAVHNRTLFGGLLEDLKLSERIHYVVAVFGSHTWFENPFITNYEVRDEGNAGGRTWLEFSAKTNPGVALKYYIGGESQFQRSHISNYGNRLGVKDTVQAIDRLSINQSFAFVRCEADLYNRWKLEASLSYNVNHLSFSRLAPVTIAEQEKEFRPELMPRLAASYLVNGSLSLRALVSRGYSPPSLQEIRSSDNTINTTLEAESGWNYETGLRLRTKNGVLWWDAAVFYYRLTNAIVQQQNAAGQSYFVNAGGTQQPGLESQIQLTLIKHRDTRLIRGLELMQAYTFSYFRFDHYVNESGDYSGHFLTGVPQNVAVSSIRFELPRLVSLFVQYTYTDRLPVNDANSAYAQAYHLLQAKASWKLISSSRLGVELSAGVDNLLDQEYSLGNDLNAVGGRYYNAAPGRNYFVRLTAAF